MSATTRWLAVPMLAVIQLPFAAWTTPLPGARVCIDDAGQRADCTADDGTSIRGRKTGVHYMNECRASDHLGRCPTDPMCFNERAQPTQCVGTVVFATAQCNDGLVTASADFEKDCAAHKGVFSKFHVKPAK